MPAGLDKLKMRIWGRLKGKMNPRTKKQYTESEAWAIATSQFKSKNNDLNDDDYVNELFLEAVRNVNEDT